MNILIIGGAGFLGSNLTRRCLEDGANKVMVVDSLDPVLKSSFENLKEIESQIEFIEGDMRNSDLMAKVVKDQDVIFNCAGQTSHPLSLTNPFLDVEINCLGNLTVLEAVRLHNKQAKLIYTSSSTVIGRAVGETVDETHSEVPLDIYSANKGVAEKYYGIYSNVHDLKTLSLRFANLYGPYGKGYSEFGFINYFISLVEANQDITIYGDGLQNRNVLYAEDAANLLYECISHDNIFGNTYFAVHREHYSVLEIAEAIIEVFGKGIIHKVPWPEVRRRIEIDNVVISAAKLYYEVKFDPKFNLKSGLEKTKVTMEAHHKLTQKERMV